MCEIFFVDVFPAMALVRFFHKKEENEAQLKLFWLDFTPFFFKSIMVDL